MFSPITVAAALIVLTAVAAKPFKLLTTGGVLAAIFVGLTTDFCGGLSAVGMLVTFFATSNLLGLWRKKHKLSLGFEKGGGRDHWQVLANGGPALVGLLIGKYLLAGIIFPGAYLALFAAGLAEANADTWATEIGSVSGQKPRSIITGKLLEPGQSGGISTIGTIASAIGAAVLGVSFALLIPHHAQIRYVAAIVIAGFCGALADSIFGASIQAQYEGDSGKIIETSSRTSRLVRGFTWIRNDAVNFTAGIVAIAVAVAALWRV